MFKKMYQNIVDYNVVQVSGIQQSDSVIYTYIHICAYMYFFHFYFSSIVGYKILRIVACAVQWVRVGGQFYTQ